MIKRRFLSFALTLRGRLLALICLATLPSLLFSFYIADRERGAALLHAKDEARYIVNLISREHLYQITGAKSLLSWLTEKMSAQENATLARDPDFLGALLAGYPQLGNIAILAPNGDVINSAYPLPGKINMANYGAIERAMKSDRIETGGYVIGPIVKKPLLHLSKAVRDKKSNVRCIVFVAIDLEWLKRLTEEIELPSDYILLIADRDGRVLANSSRRVNGGAYTAGTQIAELAEQVQNAKNMPAPKQNHFVTVPMKGIPGVQIATALPYGSIYEAANETFFRIVILLCLLTLCTVISVVFLEEIALLRYIRTLSNASQRFGQGDYSVRVPVPRGYGELESMAKVFNNMADTLTDRHLQLSQAHEQLDKLTRHLQIVRESEAQRISRDLHDEIGQVLTSIKMDLCGFQAKCSHGEILPCNDNIVTIREKLDSLVQFVRCIASDLRPPVLDRMGLVSAIELLALKSEENSDLAVELEAFDVKEPLDWLISITVYRIAQEALTNIIRHSHASVARIQLKQTDSEITLFVKDDGRGFEQEDATKDSLGIIGMRERARLVGGSLELESNAGHGTQIRVSIPLKAFDEHGFKSGENTHAYFAG